MQITNLSKIKNTEIVKFAPFVDGTEFVAEVKRVDLQKLAILGIIPNTLVEKSEKLFKKQQKNSKKEINSEETKELIKLAEIIAKESLVNPSYKEFEKHNLELTIEQMIDIFNWNMKPMTKLEDFRTK